MYSAKSDTHCKHGHPWTPENTYINSQGSRVCKTCRRNKYNSVEQELAGKRVLPTAAELLAFESNIIVDEVSGCHTWVGAISKNKISPRGYGKFYWRGKMWPVARLAHYWATGELPEDVDHIVCDDSLCANADHVVSSTSTDNIRRMNQRRRTAR